MILKKLRIYLNKIDINNAIKNIIISVRDIVDKNLAKV